MRSPLLALSMVAAVIATASARSAIPPNSQHIAPLGNAPAKRHSEVYAPHHGSDTRQITKQRGQIDRQRAHAARPIDTSGSLAGPGSGENGGVSVSTPAIGANADQGGENANSTDGRPADGSDFEGNLSNAVHGPASAYDHGAPVPSQDDHSYQQSPGTANGYDPSKGSSGRSFRLRSRRQLGGDALGHAISRVDGSSSSSESDSNSNQNGADGESVKGSETKGSGTSGGSGYSGEPGSANGGVVYNNPRSNSNE